MATAAKRQDLPPPGGYNPINYKRVPARQFFSGFAIIGGYLGMTAASAYLYFLNCKAVKKRRLEERSGDFAITPLLMAERDREYLKQLRRNREEEGRLMANVEGWEVGTWYGQPVYKSRPADELIEPTFAEYYAHADLKEFKRRAYMSLYT